MPTKIAPEEVRSLALDAHKLVAVRHSVIEEMKGSPSRQLYTLARQSLKESIIEGEISFENEADIDDDQIEFKLSKREAKRRLKLRQAKAKDQALRDKAHDLKASTGATDKQLSKRF